MSLISEKCLIIFKGRTVKPAYLEEYQQKLLIEKGLIKSEFINESGIKEPSKDTSKNDEPLAPKPEPKPSKPVEKEDVAEKEFDEKSVVKSQLDEIGVKYDGRASLDSLKELLDSVKIGRASCRERV